MGHLWARSPSASLYNSSFREGPLVSLHSRAPFPPRFEACAGEKRSGWGAVSRVFQVSLSPTPNTHSFPVSGCGGRKAVEPPRVSTPAIRAPSTAELHLQPWGISLAWTLGTWLGQRALKRGGGTSEREEGKKRGGCMFPSPYLFPKGGRSSYKGGNRLLFSLRIKAPFTGSVTSCVPASCVGTLPSP